MNDRSSVFKFCRTAIGASYGLSGPASFNFVEQYLFTYFNCFPYSICAIPDMEKVNSRMMLVRTFFILTYLLK